MGIRINVSSGLTPKLKRLQQELDDMDGLWERLSDVMIEETAILWESEGATAIPPWAPLAESTIEKKTKAGLPLDPMVETGALRESLEDPFEAAMFSQGRTSLGTFATKEFSWGTDVVNERGDSYAEYHQEGVEHNPALPVRNVVNVTPSLLARVNEAAEDWIEEALAEAGFE